ncbi:hypothetical protein [Chelativorans intermedius]|uniref:Uncharacterized protein n=1 Tax=Chelativorans intermedius TaxID=515947 RepID=A0ABV6D671_9HYPH|nr:hypothetical protein [Chelativorans intermedius]MCT8997416.1 hypothetical protein [Chelativorans intermedius]
MSKEELEAIRNSGLFDAEWYLKTYPDVKALGMDPLEHFLWLGHKLRRRPSPKFDTRSYLEQNPDVAAAGVNALVHYLGNGAHRPADGNKSGLKQVSGKKRTQPKLVSGAEKSLVDSILESKLFDASYYKATYGVVAHDVRDLVHDFLSSFPSELRDLGPLFCSRNYLELNPDVSSSGMNPLLHYILYGKKENRSAFSLEKVKYFLSKFEMKSFSSLDEILKRINVNIYYAENGNFFFKDISYYLRDFLLREGYNVCLLPEEEGNQFSESAIDIVVAPHEFFVIGAGRAWSDKRISRAVCLNTEQWQTPWFARCFSYISKSELGVLDINPNSASGLQALGLKASFVPLLPLEGTAFAQDRRAISDTLRKHKLIKNLNYPSDINQRPYDVLYVAAHNSRREKVLSLLSETLSEYECFIHSPRFSGPIIEGDLDMLSGSDFTQIALNAKVLLNIHRDDVGYFEWHRIFLYGIMNGSVVITEPCLRNPYLRPGENYIESSVTEIPELLHGLFRTDEGRKRLSMISRNNMLLRSKISSNWRRIFES